MPSTAPTDLMVRIGLTNHIGQGIERGAMNKFLIPLATAVACLLSQQHVAAVVTSTQDVSGSVPKLVGQDTIRALSALIPDAATSLVLNRTSQSVQKASHRSHRSHSSHRSHRSGR